MISTSCSFGIDALELRPDRGVRRRPPGRTTSWAFSRVRRLRAAWNTRHSVLTPLTGLILALNEDHDCQSPVFGTAQVPSSSPSGASRRISMIPPSVADAARISICSVRCAEVDPLVADPVAVLDPADALAALRARGVLGAAVAPQSRRPESVRRRSPWPGRSQATFSRYWPSPWSATPGGSPAGHQHFVQLGRLDQPVAVEIDGAGVMLAALADRTSRRGSGRCRD